MDSPVQIEANCPPLQPENMPIEREAKKPRLDGEIQGRSFDETEEGDGKNDNSDGDAEESESDYESDLDNYDGDARLREEYKLMFKQAIASDGFDIDIFPHRAIPFAAIFYAVDESFPVRWPRVQACLAYAIKEYNDGLQDDEKIELLNIVKTLSTGVSFKLFYITFNARVISTDENKVYQVRVCDDLVHRKIEVELFRLKPSQQ